MKKRVLGIMLTLAMAVGLLGGCGNASDIESADEKTEAKTEEGSTETAEKKSAEDLHIVYITPLLASDVWLVSKEGFDAAADEFGFTGDWVGPANIDVD